MGKATARDERIPLAVDVSQDETREVGIWVYEDWDDATGEAASIYVGPTAGRIGLDTEEIHLSAEGRRRIAAALLAFDVPQDGGRVMTPEDAARDVRLVAIAEAAVDVTADWFAALPDLPKKTVLDSHVIFSMARLSEAVDELRDGDIDGDDE